MFPITCFQFFFYTFHFSYLNPRAHLRRFRQYNHELSHTLFCWHGDWIISSDISPRCLASIFFPARWLVETVLTGFSPGNKISHTEGFMEVVRKNILPMSSFWMIHAKIIFPLSVFLLSPKGSLQFLGSESPNIFPPREASRVVHYRRFHTECTHFFIGNSVTKPSAWDFGQQLPSLSLGIFLSKQVIFA